MDSEELLMLAKEAGFHVAMIDPKEIPIDGKFRAFCEENLCGNYNANYACPPDCGTVEQVRNRLLAENHALVLQTIWDISSYDNKSAVQKAKKNHNIALLRLMEKLRETGLHGFCFGYGGCPLCDPCKRKENLPCVHPDKRISCMSAYCMDVTELAKRCGLEFAWTPGKLYLFGMIVFD